MVWPDAAGHQPRQQLPAAARRSPSPPKAAEFGIFPNYDCEPTSAGEVKQDNDSRRATRSAATSPDQLTFQGKLQARFPHPEAADYSGR